MDQDGKEPETQEPGDAVRIVGRAEAEAAISAGDVVSRRSPSWVRPLESTTDAEPVGRFPLSADAKPTSAFPRATDPADASTEPTLFPTESIPVVDNGAHDDETPEEQEQSWVGGVNQDDAPAEEGLPFGTDPDDEPITINVRPGGGMRFRSRPANAGSPFAEDESDAEVARQGGTTSEAPATPRIARIGVFDTGGAADEPATNAEADTDALGAHGGDEGEDAPEETDSQRQAAQSPEDGVSAAAAFQATKSNRASNKVDEEIFNISAKVAALNNVSMRQRLGTGFAFAAAALLAFWGGPAWTLVLATVVILMSAIELFDGLRRHGFRPATVLALLGTFGAMMGAYARGEDAVLVVAALVMVFSFVWHLTGVSKAQPTVNIAATVMGFLWVGGLGSFAALLLHMPNRHGMAFFIGAVACTIAYDTAAYLGGSVFGKHLLVPAVSPSKTWEGLIGGTVGSLVIGAVVGSVMAPWDFTTGLLLGIVVAVVAPLGDLSESMIKRDLGIKDMGRVLPGHGGLLDRFDALLFVLPATYCLVHLLDIV